MKKEDLILLPFIVSSLIKGGQIEEYLIPESLEYSTLDLPSYDEIEDCVEKVLKNQFGTETYLHIQEVDLDGKIIDDYKISPYPEDAEDYDWYDDYGVKRDPLELLRALYRLSRLMIAINDRNYLKIYEDAAKVIGDQHVDEPKGDYLYEFPSPLACLIPKHKSAAIWTQFNKQTKD